MYIIIFKILWSIKMFKYQKNDEKLRVKTAFPTDFLCIRYLFDQSKPMGCNCSSYLRIWGFCQIFLYRTNTVPYLQTTMRQIILWKHVKVGRSCSRSIYLLKIKHLLYPFNRDILILILFVDRTIMARVVKIDIVALAPHELTLGRVLHTK